MKSKLIFEQHLPVVVWVLIHAASDNFLRTLRGTCNSRPPEGLNCSRRPARMVHEAGLGQSHVAVLPPPARILAPESRPSGACSPSFGRRLSGTGGDICGRHRQEVSRGRSRSCSGLADSGVNELNRRNHWLLPPRSRNAPTPTSTLKSESSQKTSRVESVSGCAKARYTTYNKIQYILAIVYPI